MFYNVITKEIIYNSIYTEKTISKLSNGSIIDSDNIIFLDRLDDNKLRDLSLARVEEVSRDNTVNLNNYIEQYEDEYDEDNNILYRKFKYIQRDLEEIKLSKIHMIRNSFETVNTDSINDFIIFKDEVYNYINSNTEKSKRDQSLCPNIKKICDKVELNLNDFVESLHKRFEKFFDFKVKLISQYLILEKKIKEADSVEKVEEIEVNYDELRNLSK